MHPLAVRKIILPFHEMILGRPTLRYLRQLEASQWWSLDRLRNLQQEKLRRLLAHAHRTSSFYRNRMDAADVDPSSVCLADLSKLPTTTKDDIRAAIDDMCDSSIPGGLRDAATGGSTGSPLHFRLCRGRQASDQAARARTRRWFGIEPGERELYLWGSPLEVTAQDRMKAARDRLTNHQLLDAFDMTPAKMSRYIQQIHRCDPVHIFGYPSSLARLFRHGRETGQCIATPSLRAVFVTGEVFGRDDRALIEECTPVPVADGYGSREGGFVAHQCPVGSYHVTMESHIVELVDADDRPVGEGEPGEIVLTHLDAFGHPFIRYRTGDIARGSNAPCPCGRGLTVIAGIEGRRTDMLRTAGGGLAHGLSVIYVLRESEHVGEFQIVQKANLDLLVRIVPRSEMPTAERERIVRQLRQRIGEGIAVTLDFVERIAPDPSGKHRHVIGER